MRVWSKLPTSAKWGPLGCRRQKNHLRRGAPIQTQVQGFGSGIQLGTRLEIGRGTLGPGPGTPPWAAGVRRLKSVCVMSWPPVRLQCGVAAPASYVWAARLRHALCSSHSSGQLPGPLTLGLRDPALPLQKSKPYCGTLVRLPATTAAVRRTNVLRFSPQVFIQQQLLRRGPSRAHFRCRVRAMLASRACRSSIMIGTALDARQMRRVVDHLADLQSPWQCPHGRPTMKLLRTGL